MNVSIADIICRIEGLEGQFARDVAWRYAAFLTNSSEPPELVVRATVDSSLAVVERASSEAPVITVERLGTPGESYVILRGDNPFEAYVDMDRRVGTLTLVPNIYCFDSYLRVLWSLLLARHGGALLHGASLKLGDRAVIAVGQSGAGKTTLSRQGFKRVLSDELVAVTRDAREGAFVAHGTPFCGEFVAGTVRDAAAVEEVYLLRQGGFDGVVPAGRTSALREVLGCTFFFGPSSCLPGVLDLCADLVNARLAGELHFRPSPAVADYLEGRVCGVPA